MAEKTFVSRSTRRRRTLIIILAVLVLLVCAYVAVLILNREPVPDTEEESIILIDRDPSALTALRYTYDGEYHAFVLSPDGSWTDESDPDFPTDQTVLAEMTRDICAVTATRKISEPDSLTDYGLKAPRLTVEASFGAGGNGGVIRCSFGAKVEFNGDCYFSIEGDSSVYTVPSSLIPYFQLTKNELIAEEQLPVVSASALLGCTVVKNGAESEITDENALSSLPRLTLGSCVDYKPDDAVAVTYGLDTENAAVITVRYNVEIALTTAATSITQENSYTLTVGSAVSGNSEMRYVLLGSSPVVYEMKSEYLDVILAAAD